MNTFRYTTLIALLAVTMTSLPADADVIGTPDNSSVQVGATVLDPATGLAHTAFSAATIDYTSPFTRVETTFDLGTDGTGIMMGSADATTGQLKTYLWADNRLPAADPTADMPNVSHQEVSSGITDRIFITETFSGFLPVTLTLRVDGISAAEPGPASSPLTAIAQDILAQILVFPAGGTQQGAEMATWLGDPMDNATVTATFNLPSDTPYFDVSYTLALYQTNNNYLGEIDYSSTAVAGISLPAGYTFASESGAFLSDADGDGIADDEDNCILVPNGPIIPDAGGNNQLDAASDGYGNICDPDFDNNLRVDFADLAYMKSKFFTTDPYADLDGNGRVDFGDLAILKSMFFGPPGPSGQLP